MDRDKSRTPEEKKGAPTWIVSFSDMITLLLSFFILLQSCATTRSEELFLIGKGSFVAAINGLGLPSWLLGKRELPKLNHARSFFTPEKKDEDEEIRNDVLDAEDEKIRSTFKRMQRQMNSEASDMMLQRIDMKGFRLTFANKGELSAGDQEQLTAFVKRVRAAVTRRRVSVYVIGFTADGGSHRRNLTTAAERAGVVEQFLRRQFAPEMRRQDWDVFSWGAGEGRRWAQSMGIDVHETSVAVAIMGVRDHHE
jgi:outer membrane protein OmpA-like peptidoglycan-associated protein